MMMMSSDNLPSYLQTTIIAQMLSIGGGGYKTTPTAFSVSIPGHHAASCQLVLTAMIHGQSLLVTSTSPDVSVACSSTLCMSSHMVVSCRSSVAADADAVIHPSHTASANLMQ